MDAIKQVLSAARYIERCPPPVAADNFAEVLRGRALDQPEELAYIFLGFGRSPDIVKNYRQLDESANGIARALLERGLAGRNIVLVHPSVRDFPEAFFGCLYAGCVAVPALRPDDERERKRLAGIVRDCKPGAVLTVRSEIEQLEAYFREVGEAEVACLACDEIAPTNDRVTFSGIDPDQLAFLQYTSGSTGEPRGVMVTHTNLLHNEELIAGNLQSRENRWLCCSWLPHYHDMGLIGGLLQSIYIGRPVVLYATQDFLLNPMRWLQLISDLRISISGGPNFAYDLCVKRSKRFDLSTLDLSHWALAFNGSEPVRDETVYKFAERFASCGFRHQAMQPGYGLAEGTLMVTSRRPGEPIGRLTVNYDSLIRGHVKHPEPGDSSITLVGCGYANREGDQDIRLIDHRTGKEVAAGDVGEICVRGPSVCSGYYRQPEVSEGVFNAYAGTDGKGGLLRTGDLGFVDQSGQLYVTGRLKDVVIWNGANHYPQDIEQVLEESSSRIRGGRVAVFNVNAGSDIGVFAVAEVSLSSSPAEILDGMALEIRDSVQSRMGIPLAGIIFIAKGNMPRTSSGKIRRSECRKRYLSYQLDILHQWYGHGWQEPITRLMQGASPQDAAALVV